MFNFYLQSISIEVRTIHSRFIIWAIFELHLLASVPSSKHLISFLENFSLPISVFQFRALSLLLILFLFFFISLDISSSKHGYQHHLNFYMFFGGKRMKREVTMVVFGERTHLILQKFISFSKYGCSRAVILDLSIFYPHFSFIDCIINYYHCYNIE